MEDRIAELIDELLPSRIRDGIKGIVRNSIRIVAHQVDEAKLAVGASKIGGTPDLPPGIAWPRFGDVPQAFIAQFNLEEVSEYDKEHALPKAGMLYFFYEADSQPWGFDVAERGGWRVFYYDGDLSLLRRTLAPASLPDVSRFMPCALRYYTQTSLPPFDSALIESLELNREERDAYSALEDKVRDLQAATNSHSEHQLLGHPYQIQGDMQRECQLVSHGVGYRDPQATTLERGATDWRLLLQVDSNDEADMTWGDVGLIYYWIRQQDLQARNFDNVWLVLQCT